MTGESYVDLVSGGPIQTDVFGLNTQTSAVNITLTFPADRIQRINMTTASKKLQLPEASNYSLGQDFIVQNTGANAFTVTTNDGLTTIMTAAVGTANYIYLVTRATAQGTWSGSILGGGGAQTGANSDITSLTGLTTPLSVGQGGTGLDGDVTGGSGQYVKQASLGGAFTVGTIAAADYPTMVGDSGAGGTKGAVPAPAAGDAAAQKYLGAGGTWSTPSGTGASASEPYVTIGTTSGLSAERALTAGTGLTMVDGGAGSTVTFNINVANPAPGGNALSMPRVNGAATAIEYRTAAQVRSDLSLVIGTNVQAWNTNLDTLAAVTPGAAGLRILATASDVPQNSQSAAYTTVAADAGKHIFHPSTDANARTFTIDSNANVPYVIGTTITFINQTSQVVSIAITADTMTLANSSSTGTRSLALNGVATAIKVGATSWIINGTGLT